MLGPRLITGFVLDEFIVDKADAVAREYSQNLTVTFTLRDHGAVGVSEFLVRLAPMRKIARTFQPLLPGSSIIISVRPHTERTDDHSHRRSLQGAVPSCGRYRL